MLMGKTYQINWYALKDIKLLISFIYMSKVIHTTYYNFRLRLKSLPSNIDFEETYLLVKSVSLISNFCSF